MAGGDAPRDALVAMRSGCALAHASHAHLAMRLAYKGRGAVACARHTPLPPSLPRPLSQRRMRGPLKMLTVAGAPQSLPLKVLSTEGTFHGELCDAPLALPRSLPPSLPLSLVHSPLPFLAPSRPASLAPSIHQSIDINHSLPLSRVEGGHVIPPPSPPPYPKHVERGKERTCALTWAMAKPSSLYLCRM